MATRHRGPVVAAPRVGGGVQRLRPDSVGLTGVLFMAVATPLATMVAVVGVGLFYVLVSWAAIVGTGPPAAVALAQDSATAGQVFFGPVERGLGSWAVMLFGFLLMSGSFACGMAFHNCAARSIHAIGREDLVPGMARTIGATHPLHGSPYVAGFLLSGRRAAVRGR